MSLRIDDDNAEQVLQESLVLGHPPGIEPETQRFRESPIGTFQGVYADEFPLIPEGEWPDRIRYVYSIGGFIGQRWQSNPDADYQNSLPYCWAFSLTQAAMAARAKAGMPFVQLAAESLAGVVNYRSQGYFCDRALEYAKQHGICERTLVPKFSRNPSSWGTNWQENAKQFFPLETWDGGRSMWAETVTALLSGDGCYVGYNFWSHAVFLDGLVLDGNKIGVHTPNSHGPGRDVTLFGNKAIPDDMFVIRSMTYNA